MKPRIICLILFLALFLTASTKSLIVDNLNLLNNKTKTMLVETNNFYQKKSQHPKIIIQTTKQIDSLKPTHVNTETHTIYIIVGRNNNKTNVQIYRSKDMVNVISQKFIYDLISSQAALLKSSNKQKLNVGLQQIIRACITKIDQKFSYNNAQYELTSEQMNKLQHPNSMNMTWAIVIALIIGGVFWYLKKRRNDYS